VDAICCVPPFFYRQPDEAIVEHYRTVAAAADLPFFVYNLPQSTGVEITPELMARIQDRVPQLRGLKHSAPTVHNIRAFAKMGLECFVGNCMMMLPALTIGATGCIDGPPNVAPELWVEIWRAYNDGDIARAEEAQDRASEVGIAVRQFGMHPTLKAVLTERLGIDCGDPRPPGLPLTPEQRAILVADLERLGLTRRAAVASDD
jgi:dihydrodipicolinate synthase/N-acetylneuraminate lyase